MTAHELAAKIVTALPELTRDGRLNQMLTLEAWLLDWQRSIVANTASAAYKAFREPDEPRLESK